MSVLIKDMEMPKNCSDCPLNYDQMMCIVTGTRWWSDTMMLMDFDSDKERLYDCPLVEVPTPHGRLIDADTLVNNCEKYIKSLNPDRDGKEIAKIRWLVGILNEQSTIIEAEGSEA